MKNYIQYVLRAINHAINRLTAKQIEIIDLQIDRLFPLQIYYTFEIAFL